MTAPDATTPEEPGAGPRQDPEHQDPGRQDPGRPGRAGGDADAIIAGLVAEARQSGRLRAGSLVITAFGDMVMPRGGTVSLASLIRFLAPFGINDSQVRTAVSRLVADGWLAGSRRGRNSFYRLTDPGSRRFAAATRRIYDAGELEWEGRWQVVICPEGGQVREALRRELGWAGFGALAPGLFLHPNPPDGAAEAALEVVGLAGKVVVIDGSRALTALPETLQHMAANCWALDGLARSYTAFSQVYAPLAQALNPGKPPTPAAALQARLLLVHDYRRTLLRDPLLPSAFLPDDWPGHAARGHARIIYRALAPASEQALSAGFQGPDGALPPPDAGFRMRFGGIAIP